MLSRKIKEFQISVLDLSKAFNVTRPTVYSYIKAYDMKRSELIPENVKDVFDFIEASEYISRQNAFVLLHGGDPRKPLGEDNPLFAEGIIYLKSSNIRKILGELKKEHSFPERKGKNTYVFYKVSSPVKITFFLIDSNLGEESKHYNLLEEAREVNSLDEINGIFKKEAFNVLANFKANRERQKEDLNKVDYDEIEELMREFDKNLERRKKFIELKKKVMDFIANTDYQSQEDLEKLEIIQKLLNL